MAQRGPAEPSCTCPTMSAHSWNGGSDDVKAAQDLALRSKFVLECATGALNSEVARRLGVSLPTVGKWRSRFIATRLDGLVDEYRMFTYPAWQGRVRSFLPPGHPAGRMRRLETKVFGNDVVYRALEPVRGPGPVSVVAGALPAAAAGLVLGAVAPAAHCHVGHVAIEARIGRGQDLARFHGADAPGQRGGPRGPACSCPAPLRRQRLLDAAAVDDFHLLRRRRLDLGGSRGGGGCSGRQSGPKHLIGPGVQRGGRGGDQLTGIGGCEAALPTGHPEDPLDLGVRETGRA